MHLLQREPPVGEPKEWLDSVQGFPKLADPWGSQNLPQEFPCENPRAVSEFTNRHTSRSCGPQNKSYTDLDPLFWSPWRPDLAQYLLLGLSARGQALPAWSISNPFLQNYHDLWSTSLWVHSCNESLVQCFSHSVIRHSHLAPLGVKDPEINNVKFHLQGLYGGEGKKIKMVDFTTVWEVLWWGLIRQRRRHLMQIRSWCGQDDFLEETLLHHQWRRLGEKI